MRRLLVVVVLLSLMLVMRSFQAHTDAPGNVITLAAIGFVVLTTFAVADMGTHLSLPRVTGFIITGVALGPSAANILSAEVVDEMRMFNTLALGLIATSAGLELDLKTLLPLFKTLGSTTAVKVLLGVPLVGLTLFAMARYVDLGVHSFEARAALAVIMGVLSIGTSPSISLAILTETKAKGRLADLVLGAAVFKDLVVVVCLAIGLAVSAAILDPGNTTDSGVLVHVSRELAGSLLAGAVLGAILIAYVRFIQAEMLLFVAAMILVVAELCRVFHLEILLVFIAAGFTVRNFSPYEHAFMKPLELVALPVFVVFFTIAGASIQVATMWSILPAAAAVCAVRAGVYWVSAKVGNAVGNESAVIKSNAWSAYLPQAGVTLGLVGLAAQKIPALGEQITTTGMAIVAINLLIGPVTLRTALARAGEIPGTKSGAADPSAVTPSLISASDISELPLPGLAPLDPKLAQYAAELQASTTRSLSDALAQLEATEGASLHEEPSPEQRLTAVQSYRRAARSWYEAWISGLTALPIAVTVPRTLEGLAPESDASWWQRVWFHLDRLRWRLTSARLREVPVRLCARTTVEPTVAKLAVELFELALQRQFLPSARDAEEASAIPPHWERDLSRAFAEFARTLQTVHTPHQASKTLRFSAVEPTIRADLAQLDESRDDAHSSRAAALWGAEVAKVHLATLHDLVTAEVAVHLFTPARNAGDRVATALVQMVEEVVQLLDGAPTSQTTTHSDIRRELTRTYERGLDALSHNLPRAAHAVRELTVAFRTRLDGLPEELRCYQPPTDPSQRYGSIRRLNLRELAETYLLRRLVPQLDQSARDLSNTFAHLLRDVKECLASALLSLDSRSDETVRSLPVEVNAMTHRLTSLASTVHQQIEEQIDHQRLATTTILAALEREVTTVQLLGETTTHRLRQLLRRLGRRLRPLYDPPVEGSSKEVHLDPRGRLRGLEQWVPEGIDEVSAGWLSQEPVRDERIYSDEHKVLDLVLGFENAWRNGQRAAVLLCGETGSGKTSLLNMCEIELRGPRIFRLDAEGPEQTLSFNHTLANLLGCRPTEASISYTLAVLKPILLIDNLSRWLSRGRDPLEELANLLLLIARSHETFWIVTLDAALRKRVAPFVSIDAPFTSVVDIPPATRKDVERLVSSRVTRARKTVAFNPTPFGLLLGKLGLPGDDLLYFIKLRRHSRGSPGRALALALASVAGEEDTLRFDRDKLPLLPPPLGDQLTVTQLGTLLVLVQHGPLALRSIAERVGVDIVTAELDTAFLCSLGVLLEDGQTYALKGEVRWIVADELERIGAVSLRGAQSRNELRKLRAATLVPGAVAAIVLGYLLSTWMVRSHWSSWVPIAIVLLLLSLPAARDVLSGLTLRLLTPLRRGDSIQTPTADGVIRHVGLSHLRLTDDTSTEVLVPYQKLLTQRLAVQPGTRHGGRVQVRLDTAGLTDGIERIHRAAHLCPYRAPTSPVSLREDGTTVFVEFYSWHRDSTRAVATYLAWELQQVRQRQETSLRPQE